MTTTRYTPLDMRCKRDGCNAPPGSRCIWRTANRLVTLRHPHAERVTAAREATDRARRQAVGSRPGWSSPPWQPGPT